MAKKYNPKPFICVQSSYTPPQYDRMTFNDLACLHSGRDAEGFYRRMKSAYSNQQS